MKIGILGYGIVGGGVDEIISKNPLLKDWSVVKVFNRPGRKQHILKERFAATWEEVCSDPEIDTVVETLGGEHPAYEAIKYAMEHKKNVLTSNKEVVSKHMLEFYKVAKENDVYFLIEAAVGGGVPLICSLIDQVRANRITKIRGVVNGTTNYIVTKVEEGLSFNQALKDAQKKGYAEADPRSDIEGIDPARKLAILSSLAYGRYVEPDSIIRESIDKITQSKILKAMKRGKVIRYLATSEITKSGEIKASVKPDVIFPEEVFYLLKGAMNAIEITTEYNGVLTFVGQGAGKFPTASAIIQDLQRIQSGIEKYYWIA